MEIVVRQAFENDLPDILKLYSQPDMDNGDVLEIEEAKKLFGKICSYPDYKIMFQSLREKSWGHLLWPIWGINPD